MEHRSREFLTVLAKGVYQHEALNKTFFDIWTSRALPINLLAVFARNYGGDRDKELVAVEGSIFGEQDGDARNFVDRLQARRLMPRIVIVLHDRLHKKKGRPLVGGTPTKPRTTDLVARTKSIHLLSGSKARGSG